MPTLIFAALCVTRGAAGQEALTPLLLVGGITLGCLAVLPFAAAAALRVNLR
jgi:heme exporter protein B